MANNFAGLTDQELLQARHSYEKSLECIREAIDNFDKTPLPSDSDAREKLIESHHKLRIATEAALTEIDELLRLRASAA